MVILKHYKTDSDKKRLPCHDCGVQIAVVNRRAKDGNTKLSSGMVGMGRMVGGGAARPVPLATEHLAYGDALRTRTPHCYQLVAGGRRGFRLPALLLFYFRPGTQGQYYRRPTVVAVVYQAAQLPTAAFGHRRHAHQTLRSKSTRGGYSSQSPSGTGRCKIP